MKTVLFVGAGRHQRRAILRAKELGLRVVAVDRNPDALGPRGGRHRAAWSTSPTSTAVLEAPARLEARRRADGRRPTAPCPVVAAVAEARGLPGIGIETAHLMTHKVAMRRRLAEAGVPQPRFAAVRTLLGAPPRRRRGRLPGGAEAGRLGRPARRSSASSRSTTSTRTCTRRSPRRRRGEAILEEFVEGTEMNGIVIARDGEAIPLTLSDRLRPPGDRLRRRLDPRLSRRRSTATSSRSRSAIAAHTVHALGLRDRDRVPAADRRARRPRRRRRVRGADPRRADGRPRAPRGRASTWSRCSSGWRSARSCPTSSCCPRFSQPLAIRFLTAEPGPLPTGRVTRVGSLEQGARVPGRRAGGHVSRRSAR